MSGIRRRDGRPLWIDDCDQVCRPLHRIDLGGRSGSRFDEAWLQALLHHNPTIFPTEQIEPGFGDLIPICRELEVSLFTNTGNIHLDRQITKVITIMELSSNKDEFNEKFWRCTASRFRLIDQKP
jgi:hypothetical protein